MNISRRSFIKSSLLTAGALAGMDLSKASWASGFSPTLTENEKPGTGAWQLTNPAASHEVEGYSTLCSVNRGGSIGFCISAGSDTQVTLDIYRMGWYNGLGGRELLGPITVPVTLQPGYTVDPNTQMVECPWSVTYTLSIPYSSTDLTLWCSGVYLVKMTGVTSGKQSYIMFVVRDDARVSNLLFQSSVTTFQAYNIYGGCSLYTYNSPIVRSDVVSFNRPYGLNPAYNEFPGLAYGIGAAEFLLGGDQGPPGGWEYCTVQFLESNGYDVTYCTDIDTHSNPNQFAGHAAFLIVGHDEYWSLEMRNNVTAAIASGTNVGVFSGNTCYWQIRLEADSNGNANRWEVCYKYYPNDMIGTYTQDPYYLNNDPSQADEITVRWRDGLPNSVRVPSPEEAFLGTMYVYGADSAFGDWTVSEASSWVFNGTGLTNGQYITGLVAYECDAAQGAQPANTQMIATSPYTGNTYTGTGTSNATLYVAPSGASVFATGCINWAWGLSNWGTQTTFGSIRPVRLSSLAQQITANVMNQFIASTAAVSPNPPVSAPGGPYYGETNYPVQFNGSGSSSPLGPLASYSWNFGDGTVGSGVSPSHAYGSPGIYSCILAVTDSQGAITSAIAEVVIEVQGAYADVTADSVFNVDSDGTNYIYPPTGIGDGVIPVPSPTDQFDQWFAESPLPMNGSGVLNTPVNIYITFNQQQTVAQCNLYQASWYDNVGFHAQNFALYLANSSGAWTQVATGTLQNQNGALTTVNFAPTIATQARIQILSSYDTSDYQSVGLAEVVFPSYAPVPTALPGGPYNGNVGFALAFNGSASYSPNGPIVTYAWNFGDGQTGSGATPSHTYNAAGTYTVSLTITDSSGGTATGSTTATIVTPGRYETVTADSTFDVTSGGIRYYYPPSAVGDYVVPVPSSSDQYDQWFAATPQAMTNGVLNTPINITMSFWTTQVCSSVQIYQAAWYDNLAFHAQNFTVQLRTVDGSWTQVAAGTLQNQNGALTTLSFPPMLADLAQITILSSYDTNDYQSVGLAEVVFPPSGPTCSAGGPYSGQPGQAIQFTGTASSPNGAITAYAWNFGDGTTGSGASPTHTYNAPGSYTASLTATDAVGGTATSNAAVTIASATSVTGLTLAPTSIVEGGTSTGTVALSAAAPMGGVTVNLSSGNAAAATVPANVTVAAGQTTATFIVTSNPVSSTQTAAITASYSGSSASATLTVTAISDTGLTLSPTTVVGGNSSTGTLTLSSAAPTGGLTVTLSSGNTSAATVPASVSVAAGQSTATFTVSTSAVTSNQTASITAAVNGSSQSATLTVTAITETGISLSPSSVVGGVSSTGTVTISSAAPPSGLKVGLSSNNAAATVPASVIIAAGQTAATFTVSTTSVTSTHSASITATVNGSSNSATLTLTPVTESGLSLSPSTVIGGATSTGTVTLSAAAPAGGLTVGMKSSNTAVATVPASVTVSAGSMSATFTVTSKNVTSNQTAAITATSNGSTQSATLTVQPITNSALSLSPSTVVGGNTSTGTVTLTAAAPFGGLTVALKSSNTAAATAPSSVTVAAGRTSATFTVSTSQVTSNQSPSITATLNGASQSATLTVQAVTVKSMAVSPTSVIGGNSSTGTVTLAVAAPSGGVSVALKSSNSGASVPSSVTVAAGATTATFTVTTSAVSSATNATITATKNGSAIAALTITAPALSSLSLNPTSVRGGRANSTGTVTLTGKAPSGGSTVTLSSNTTSAATVPGSVTVPAGQTTATFTVTTKIVTSSKSVTISATYPSGTTMTATLTVTT